MASVPSLRGMASVPSLRVTASAHPTRACTAPQSHARPLSHARAHSHTHAVDAHQHGARPAQANARTRRPGARQHGPPNDPAHGRPNMAEGRRNMMQGPRSKGACAHQQESQGATWCRTRAAKARAHTNLAHRPPNMHAHAPTWRTARPRQGGGGGCAGGGTPTGARAHQYGAWHAQASARAHYTHHTHTHTSAAHMPCWPLPPHTLTQAHSHTYNGWGRPSFNPNKSKHTRANTRAHTRARARQLGPAFIQLNVFMIRFRRTSVVNTPTPSMVKSSMVKHQDPFTPPHPFSSPPQPSNTHTHTAAHTKDHSSTHAHAHKLAHTNTHTHQHTYRVGRKTQHVAIFTPCAHLWREISFPESAACDACVS